MAEETQTQEPSAADPKKAKKKPSAADRIKELEAQVEAQGATIKGLREARQAVAPEIPLYDKRFPKPASFIVPQEMDPGVVRNGVGRFKPGAIYTWPDMAYVSGERISHRLIPVDPYAQEMLEHMWAKEIDDGEVVIAAVGAVPKDTPAGALKQFTVAEAANELATPEGRLADS